MEPATSLGLAIAAVFLSVVILVGYTAFAAFGGWAAEKYRTATSAFMETINGLIAKDNIDRAIKLCGTEISETHQSPLPRGAKKLLTRAHQPDELDGRHREALADMEPMQKRMGRQLKTRPRNFTLGLIFCLAGLVAMAWGHLWAIITVILILLAMILPFRFLHGRVQAVVAHYAEVRVALTELHNTLVARSRTDADTA